MKTLQEGNGSTKVNLRPLVSEKLDQVFDNGLEVSLLDLVPSETPLEVTSEPQMGKPCDKRILGGVIDDLPLLCLYLCVYIFFVFRSVHNPLHHLLFLDENRRCR